MSAEASPVETSADRLQARVEALEAAIRKHRDQHGDDRCYLDDFELYAILPEGAPGPEALALPDRATFLANCARFHATRQVPGTAPAEGPCGRWATAEEVGLIELGRQARGAR